MAWRNRPKALFSFYEIRLQRLRILIMHLLRYLFLHLWLLFCRQGLGGMFLQARQSYFFCFFSIFELSYIFNCLVIFLLNNCGFNWDNRSCAFLSSFLPIFFFFFLFWFLLHIILNKPYYFFFFLTVFFLFNFVKSFF